jgi:energy-converting hydrogenase Eha subunit F
MVKSANVNFGTVLSNGGVVLDDWLSTTSGKEVSLVSSSLFNGDLLLCVVLFVLHKLIV